MRSTAGSSAATRISSVCACVQTFGIDVEPVVSHRHGGRHEFALFARKLAIGHRREPDVGIEPDLMAGVAGQHRAAARLRHVADQKAVPSDLLGLVRQSLEKCDQLRMAPIAIARQPHDLPGRAVDRQRDGARKAAAANRSRSNAASPGRAWSCARTIPAPASTNRDVRAAARSCPRPCRDLAPGPEPVAARNKATSKRASAGIINAPQCFGVRKPSAETRRHAPGDDTLPRVGRAVQT